VSGTLGRAAFEVWRDPLHVGDEPRCKLLWNDLSPRFQATWEKVAEAVLDAHYRSAHADVCPMSENLSAECLCPTPGGKGGGT